MRYIEKGEEPRSLTEYKQKKDAYFDGYPYKDHIRERLLKEQGYLCGYCMRRLNSVKDVKIEHLLPQSKLKEDPKEALNYKKMIGVCYGNQNTARDKRALTCDAHRGNADLTVTPLSKTCIAQIKYRSNGEIYSDEPDIEKDLNETLNLNCNKADAYLVTNRKEAINACKRQLLKLQEKGIWKESILEAMLKRYERTDSEGRYEPYSGIVIYYLKKKLRTNKKN